VSHFGQDATHQARDAEQHIRIAMGALNAYMDHVVVLCTLVLGKPNKARGSAVLASRFILIATVARSSG